MPSSKDAKPMTTLERIESLIKKIWLANLGICSRSLDEIQTRYQRLNNESQKAIDELINRGRSVEAEAKEAIGSNRKNLENRISQVKQRLTFKSKLSEQLDEVNAKLDELTRAASKA